MGRSRVLSFMSAFGGPPKTPPPPASSPATQQTQQEINASPVKPATQEVSTPVKTRTERSLSRPMSMVGAYQPPLMEIAQDTIPELLPIFTFLNSHSNKLYQEGYFLKLNDLDSHGKPNIDRSWTECFAQLVGTVLSLWDAAALDAAGQDGEVAPTFINLADASIKMIETLPTRAQDVQPLQNVLSISTAGKNRYLLHFNNINSLTQWTAGIRLAMYEHATLQEAYTGSLIAGKGKTLNNIRVIMDRTRLKTEDWARVRFGAGTPWRRCWCVISPPDEKEFVKHQKSIRKKSAYDRSQPVLKGDIKFYDTRKIGKKTQPIATIRDAYSAYAIYPQSKPLIDQSTLVKVEGTITIHTAPETTTEGFVFVMPEVHPAVTGFEIMLRWLFPAYDVFGLYGRPNRLVADTLDTRSLMFALPQEKRYGYLEIFDVATLIHTEGSQNWDEREWRKRLKELTSERISKLQSSGSRPGTGAGSRRGHRNSLPSRSSRGGLRFEDGAQMRSTPSLHSRDGRFTPPAHTNTAPATSGDFQLSKKSTGHQRSVSESVPFATPRRQRTVEDRSNYTPSRLSYEATSSQIEVDPIPPPPPTHGVPVMAAYRNPQVQRHTGELDSGRERSSSESERQYRGSPNNETRNIQRDLMPNAPPAPVAAPPAFAHQPGAKPQTRPYHSPELRRANSRMSSTTLSQLAAASAATNNTTAVSDGIATAGAAAAWRSNNEQREGRYSEDQGQRGVIADTNKGMTTADHTSVNEGMVLADATHPRPNDQRPYSPFSEHSKQTNKLVISPVEGPAVPFHGYLSPATNTPRSVSPLSQSSTYSPSPTPLEISPSPNKLNASENTQRDFQSDPAASRMSAAGIAATFTHTEPERQDQLNRTSTNKSISRKPLPTLPNKSLPLSRSAYSDNGDERQDISRQGVTAPTDTSSSRHRQENDDSGRRPSFASSEYDSPSSPDYASTRKSTDTKRSAITVEKTRAGVLKTVGAVDPSEKDVIIGDVHYRPENSQYAVKSEIPNIDFGPTQLYDPASRNKPGVATPPLPATFTSVDNASSSPQYGVSGTHSRTSSGQGSDPYNRSPSRNLATPEGAQRSASRGSENESQRNIPWQPGMATGSNSPGSRQAITPEQFVQQRAAANRVTPVYAHNRNQSSTPPLTHRNSSGDWSGQTRPAPPLHEISVRPQSRGASLAMNTPTDYSTHLSAREQEHVARVTGSPLINIASNPKQAPPGTGLIGAIEAREREKKDMKEGLSGQLVQHAIAQRQQQAQGYQYGQPSPTPSMHIPGQFPQTPQTPYPGWAANQQQFIQSQQISQPQQYAPPGRQVYWNTAYHSPQQHNPSQYQQNVLYQQNAQNQQSPQKQQNPQYQQAPLQRNQPEQDQYNPYFPQSQARR